MRCDKLLTMHMQLFKCHKHNFVRGVNPKGVGIYLKRGEKCSYKAIAYLE